VSSSDVDSEAKIQLTRMEGKLDLLNDRHETMRGDITEVKTTITAHSGRIQQLEAKDQQRIGAIGAVKILWGVGGVSIATIAAALLRHFGA